MRIWDGMLSFQLSSTQMIYILWCRLLVFASTNTFGELSADLSLRDADQVYYNDSARSSLDSCNRALHKSLAASNVEFVNALSLDNLGWQGYGE